MTGPVRVYVPVDAASLSVGAGAVVTKGKDVAAGQTVVGVPARPLGESASLDADGVECPKAGG